MQSKPRNHVSVVVEDGVEKKRCKRCQRLLPVAYFYFNPSNRTYYPNCRECTRILVRERVAALTPAQKQQRRERQRIYLRKYLSAYQRTNGHSARRTKLRDEVRMRRKARQYLNELVRSKKVRKPEECERCHNPAKVQAHHHHGYDRTHWADIVWLCRDCHLDLHKITSTNKKGHQPASS